LHAADDSLFLCKLFLGDCPPGFVEEFSNGPTKIVVNGTNKEDPQTKIDINSVGATLLLTFKCCGVAFAPFLGGFFADNGGYASACDNMWLICISYTVIYFFVTFVFCTS